MTLFFSQIMQDPEITKVAQAVTKLSEESALKKFRYSRINRANKVLPESPWKMLGLWKANEQKRMILTNATSNVGAIYQLANSKDSKSIPYLFEKLPELGGKDFSIHKSQYIQTCIKGFIALAKPLIDKKTYNIETIQLLNKFHFAYPHVEETTELLLRLLLIKQDFGICKDIYEYHAQVLNQSNKEPSKILRAIYTSLEKT